jgi:transcription factor IIIB 90 kDa subunit
MVNCKECGHTTEYAQDIASAVCTNCGTLADPSQQNALTSSSDFINHVYPRDAPASIYSRPTTLKSIRRNAQWDLPGQAAESRNERNKVLFLLLFFILFPSLASSHVVLISLYHFPVRYP